MTLKRIRLERNGEVVGTFECADENEALTAHAQQQGYRNLRAWAMFEKRPLAEMLAEFSPTIEAHLD